MKRSKLLQLIYIFGNDNTMLNEIDQMSGAVKYYGVKINGNLKGGAFLSESAASQHGQPMCVEGDTMIVVPVTSDGQEILLG